MPDGQETSDLATITQIQNLMMEPLAGFFLCLVLGLICFLMASFYLPWILFRSRQFCLYFSLGSLFWLLSFSFVYGPENYVKGIFSEDRAVFTAAYVSSLIATLYTSYVLKATFLTIISGLIQIFALLWYLSSFFPGGTDKLYCYTQEIARWAGNTMVVQ